MRHDAGPGRRDSNRPALLFRDVHFTYPDAAERALTGLSLEVMPGELVALVGGNGSGKSTAARLANALLLPDRGLVEADGISTRDLSRVWDVRARVGLLFQNPDDQIVGATVADDIAFGLENTGVAPKEMRHRVGRIMDELDLTREAEQEPHLLSGGQRQRVALAGVLVLDPAVLVLDEPTSLLDLPGRRDVARRIDQVRSRNVGVLVITQHMDEVLRADRLHVLHGGVPRYRGSAKGFFRSNRHGDLPLADPPGLALWRELAGLRPNAATAPNHGKTPPVTEEELIERLRSSMAAGPREGARTGEPTIENGQQGGNRVPRSPAGQSGGDQAAAGQSGGDQAAGDQVATPAPPTRAALVRLSDVSFVYQARTPLARTAIDRVTLTLGNGGVVAVVGATAAGKSTLLQLIAGLLKPTSGDRSGVPLDRTGYVFQRPESQLFAATVREDVAVGPSLHGLGGEELVRRVDTSMARVGLDPERYGPRRPHELSVGEQRRAGLAGILALEPTLLVLDEPGTGLDPAGRRAIMSDVVAWGRESGERRTLVFTSHDLDEVSALADEAVLLNDGRVAAHGPVETVLGDSALLESAGLIPPLPARVAKELDIGSPGSRPVTAVALAMALGDRMTDAGDAP